MHAWEYHSHLIAELAVFEQWNLHRFFAMSEEMGDEAAVAHRRQVSKSKPSLPSQAGRALAHFERVVQEWQAMQTYANGPDPKSVPTSRGGRRQATIRVTLLARPTIDALKLAQVLMQVAAEDQKNGGELLKRLKK